MKFHTVLRGGLGNQLFQYSFARALAISNRAEITFDLTNGFRFDYRYRRNYELHRFGIPLKQVKPSLGNLLWGVEKIGSRGFWNLSELGFRSLGIGLLREKAESWSDTTLTGEFSTYFLTGYWQSYKYFCDAWSTLSRDFKGLELTNLDLHRMAKRISDSNSLAVGIRLFEETHNSSLMARNGNVKSAESWRKVVDKAYSELGSPQIYVFGTKISDDLLKSYGLDNKRHRVISTDEFSDSLDALYLFSAARNHLFNNSTFYWWGAYLRSVYFENADQRVFASDNFLNLDCLPLTWEKW
jgi:hypothetical protein